MCEGQLAEKRRLFQAWKSDERCNFVVEHGGLELLLAIAELLRELVGLLQVQCQLVVTFPDTLKKRLRLDEKLSHPLAHISNGDLGGRLGRPSARQALALVRVDLGH